MRKILFVINSFKTGGAEKSTYHICCRLTKFKPVICVLFPNKDETLRELFIQAGIEIIELRITGKFWLFAAVRKMAGVIRHLNPDIVHAQLFHAELVTRIIAWKSKSILVGSFINDSYAKERFQNQSFVANTKLNLLRLIDALSAKLVPYFTSITSTIAKTNSQALAIPMRKITVINRGRQVQEYNVVHPVLEEGNFIFLTVARLLKRKGYVELLNAASQLKSRGYSFQIQIAGEGHDRSLFESLSVSLDVDERVLFLGNRTDVVSLLEKAHCFVFPSHYEGQGGALVEAMLAGKPIVATRIPVFEEQLKDHEQAKLFRLFDANDLAEKMAWMMDHYSEGVKLGLAARLMAVERFDIELIVNQYERFYTDILQGR